MLRFANSSEFKTVIDKLETDYEAFNASYEDQFPGYTAEQLDYQDSISNFNEWQTVEGFELNFPGFASKRKDLYVKETNWLNATENPTDATDPDNEDMSSDYFYNTIANLNNKFIIGYDTYEYRLEGIYRNGELMDEDDAAALGLFTLNATTLNIGLCSYCDSCRNWQRKKAFSSIYTDDKGRQWQFKEIIAIRGIYPDKRGHVVGTIKARRKVGRRFKRKRAVLTIQMIGKIWTNRCVTSGPFNSGVYQSRRPRNHMRRKYAALGDQFFRAKRLDISGAFQITPQGNSVSFGEVLKLTW